MHKHISEQLIDVKIGCHEEVQAKHIININMPQLQHIHGKKCQDIHYQQILCCFGYSKHLLNEIIGLKSHKSTKNICYYILKCHYKNFFLLFSPLFFIFCLIFESILLYLRLNKEKTFYN
jgi:hypothetical protein